MVLDLQQQLSRSQYESNLLRDQLKHTELELNRLKSQGTEATSLLMHAAFLLKVTAWYTQKQEWRQNRFQMTCTWGKWREHIPRDQTLHFTVQTNPQFIHRSEGATQFFMPLRKQLICLKRNKIWGQLIHPSCKQVNLSYHCLLVGLLTRAITKIFMERIWTATFKFCGPVGGWIIA